MTHEVTDSIIIKGYEPAGFTVHPPPPPPLLQKQQSRIGQLFLRKKLSQKKIFCWRFSH